MASHSIRAKDISNARPAVSAPYKLGTSTQHSFIAFDKDPGGEPFQAKLKEIWSQAYHLVTIQEPNATDIRVNFSSLQISYVVGGKRHYIDQFALDPNLMRLMTEVRDVAKRLAAIIHSSQPGINANRSLSASSPFQITTERWQKQQVKSPEEFVKQGHFAAMYESLDRDERHNAILNIEVAHEFVTQLKANLEQNINKLENNQIDQTLTADQQKEAAEIKQRQLKMLNALLKNLKSANLFALYWAIASWGRLDSDCTDPVTSQQQVATAKRTHEAMFKHLQKTAGRKWGGMRKDESVNSALLNFSVESGCLLMHDRGQTTEFVNEQDGVPPVGLSIEELIVFQLMQLVDSAGNVPANEDATTKDFSALGLPKDLPPEDTQLLQSIFQATGAAARAKLLTAQTKLQRTNSDDWRAQRAALAT